MTLAVRVVLTILSVVQALATVLIDVNRTHARNPSWPGHARFHLVWQSLSQPLFAIIIVMVIWWPGAYTAERFYLGASLTAVPCIGFVLAQASRREYGGTLSDPNGIPPLRFPIFGHQLVIDGNAAAVYCALIFLALLVVFFRYAHRST